VKWELTGLARVDVAVWVSVAKLENNWRANVVEYIGPGGSGNAIAGRYENFSEWVGSHARVGMPEICLVDGTVRISNGRHRFSWFRDHGMIALQIQVPPDQVDLFREQFGTEDQLSEWLDVERISQ